MGVERQVTKPGDGILIKFTSSYSRHLTEYLSIVLLHEMCDVGLR